MSQFPLQLVNRKGFTLIELIMVLTVLIALTGIVLPQVDFLRRTSDKSTGAAGIRQIADNVQLYRTVNGNYPNGWDSLVDGTGGALMDSSAFGSKLGLVTLTANQALSLTRVGINQAFHHEKAPYASSYRNLPGNSAVTPVAVTAGTELAQVTNADIIGSVYPNGSIPAGVTLVAMGAGPNLTSLGKTLVAAPTYAGVDALTRYNRFAVIFAVYDDGKRAQLKGALDSSGDFLDQEIMEVYENNLE
jgi:prepilin-type N-terminal cleavage/methylation domain-containing protein